MSAPTAPLIDIRPEVGFSSILFYWRPPASDGGSPVLYYTLECPAISFSANISTTADTYLVDNLARTTDFTFTMTATNANGTGPAATYRTVQTGLVPFGPTQATASTLTNTIAYLTWNLSTLATNEATPKWFVVTITPSTPTLSSFKRCAYIYERAKTFTVPSTNIFYQFLVQAVSDPGYCVPFAFTSTLGFGTGGPLFAPTNLTNLQIWVDAADAATVSTSVGTSNVVGVTDKSANAYRFTGGTGYTYNVTKFNGTYPSFFNSTGQIASFIGSNGSILINQPITAFYVGVRETNGEYIHYPATLAAPVLAALGNGVFLDIRAATPFTTSYSISTNFLATAVYNGPSSLAYTNGQTAQISSVGTNAMNTLMLGGTPYNNYAFIGHMCEYVFYNTILTPFDRQKVEGYLAWKWGLQSNLPASHPFRTAVPLTTSVFSPSSFSSLMLWMDAGDSSSMTVSSGVVTAWSDKSGRGNSATTITGTPLFSNTAIGTRSAIWMNGTNTSFQGSYVNMGTTLTAFTVATLSNTSQVNGRLLVVGQSNLNDFDGSPGALVFLRLNSTLGTYRSNTMRTAFPEIYNTPFMMRTTFTGTTISTVFNGTGVSTAAFSGSFSTLQYNIGYKFGPFTATAEYWGGYVGETLIYNNALSTDDCQTVEGYLAWKWGLQASLPITHPYRLRSPAFNYTFSPSSISGMRLWYDAQDTAYVRMVGATSTVSSILDKSGFGFNLSNPLGVTRGTQLFNGAYPSFYEANDSGNNTFGSNTSFTISQPFTLIALAQASNVNQWHILMDSPTAAGRVIYYYDNNNARWTINAGNDVPINFDIRTSPNSLLVAYYSTTNSFVYMNGSTTVSNANVGTTNMTNGICLGKHPTIAFNYTGHLCEFMMFNRILTTTERQQVEGYVAWRWGINTGLPSNHPYRFAPPS